MSETTFTFQVDEDLKHKFTSAAEHEVWLRREVQLGLDAANAGHLVPSEQVEAEFAARREETRRKLPGAGK